MKERGPAGRQASSESPRPSEGSSWSGLPPLCCAHDKTVYAWTSDPLRLQKTLAPVGMDTC